jgi:uncharacterized membrane protein YhaH (DUF805 family)
MNRQTLLWSLVVFFGAGLLFNAINEATEGESTGLRILAQVLALAVIVGVITLVVRRR